MNKYDLLLIIDNQRNRSLHVSLGPLQIRSESGVPGGGMTAGLSSVPACVRVVVRDVAGKHSWDSAVLYGPPLCPGGQATPPPTRPHPQAPPQGLQLHTPPGPPARRLGDKREVQEEVREEEEEEEEEEQPEEEQDCSPVEKEKEQGVDSEKGEDDEEKDEDDQKEGEDAVMERGDTGSEQLPAPPLAKRVCREAVPGWDSLREGDDTLDEMLQYLGYSSPECLQRAGKHTQTHLNYYRPDGTDPHYPAEAARRELVANQSCAHFPQACLSISPPLNQRASRRSRRMTSSTPS